MQCMTVNKSMVFQNDATAPSRDIEKRHSDRHTSLKTLVFPAKRHVPMPGLFFALKPSARVNL
jgi:hypothetical protein